MKLITFLCLTIITGNAFADNVFAKKIQALEKDSNSTVGVALVRKSGELVAGYNQQQRFAMCSTFKLPLAALTLSRIDSGQEKPDRKLRYDAHFVEEYAPATQRYLASGYMTVAEANQASLQLSDNSAANLLLREAGGPPALTEYFRHLGDNTSRLDRTEPTLNTNLPDDRRDTTTPIAIAEVTAKVVFGEALSPASKLTLQRLLIGNTTGDKVIRAGLPTSWIIGDKTGSCERGGRNDVAFFTTNHGESYVLAVYTNTEHLTGEQRDVLIAAVAKVATEHL